LFVPDPSPRPPIATQGLVGSVEMASAASGGGAAAPPAARSADHIAWEQSVKDAAANGGHKPDEYGEYRCRCESCSMRIVTATNRAGSLNTRRADMSEGRRAHAIPGSSACLMCLFLRQVPGLQPCVLVARGASHPHWMAQTQREHLRRRVRSIRAPLKGKWQ
jgi:hypothetical protein